MAMTEMTTTDTYRNQMHVVPKEAFFIVGTVVYLKSGSPPMTVNSIRGGSQVGRKFVSVEWFNEAELKRDMFDPECLTSEKPAA